MVSQLPSTLGAPFRNQACLAQSSKELKLLNKNSSTMARQTARHTASGSQVSPATGKKWRQETSSFSLCGPLWHLCFVDFHEEDRTTAWCHKDSIKHLAYYPKHFCVCFAAFKDVSGLHWTLASTNERIYPEAIGSTKSYTMKRAICFRSKCCESLWFAMYGSFSDQKEGIIHLLTRILRRVGPEMTAGMFFCGSGSAGSFQQDFASLCCTTFTLTGSEELSNSNHWRTLMVVIYSIRGQMYDELKMPFLAFSYMGHRLPLCKI